MLKLKHLIEDPAIAEQLLQEYDFKELEYGFFRSSSNVIFGVKGDGRFYFLRYTTIDERNAASIEAELDFILYLRAHGIHANQPVLTKSGNYLIQKGEYLAVLFESVGESSLGQCKMTSELATLWGEELGKFHQLSTAYHKLPNETKRMDYNACFSYIRSILNKTNEKELLSLADGLEASFDHLPKTDHNYGLCHYDFEMDNVFYNEQSKQFHIIDFDDSMYHFFSIDLIQVLTNIDEDVEDSTEEIKAAFLSGYEKYMIVPNATELKLAEKFVLLYGYARLTYCLSYPPEKSPDWMNELIAKLENARSCKRNLLLSNTTK